MCIMIETTAKPISGAWSMQPEACSLKPTAILMMSAGHETAFVPPVFLVLLLRNLKVTLDCYD